ncbi:MAG: SH3 domain-containing protein [Oscillospiraceae bacterium]|nr:SH3 domain-containing protein [Oscillospiraceae bacterium]
MNRSKQKFRSVTTKALAIVLTSVFLLSAVTGVASMANTPFSTVAQAYTTFAKGSSVLTTTELNLRKSASSTGAVITVLKKGTKLTVTAKNTSSWVAVKTSSGKTGYVSTAYLKLNETLVKYETTDALNYRSSPSSSGKLKGTLKKGATVNVVSGYTKTANGLTWYKIKIGTSYYYAAAKYLKKAPATVAATGVTLNKTTASVTVGGSVTLKATVSPSSATDKTVTWSSANKAIATVSSSGIVKGIKAGSVKITAKTANGKTAACTVTVKASSSNSGEKLLDYVTIDNVNYRSAPNLEKESIQGVLQKGTAVKVVSGSSVQGDNVNWVKIKRDDSYYYVSLAYLKESTGDEDEPEPTEPSEDLVSYTTTEGVNYRSSPSLSGAKKGTLSAGTVVSVVNGYAKEADGYTWYKIKIGSNDYYLVSNYVKKGVAGTEVSVPALKTLYLNTYSGATWKSSDESVATVQDGFVYGVKKGSATISCKTSSGTKYWNVNVTAAAPVKLAYATPNVVNLGDQVTFVAITDTSRNAVQFTVNGKSKIVTSYETESAEARNGFPATKSRIWKYTTTINQPGTYTAKITSSTKADGSNMSSSAYTTSAFIVSTTSASSSSVEERRMSDGGLEVIASWEGYLPTVYLDPLTSTVVPTVGYGYTFGAGATFYNNLTKSEAWALLCEAVNKESYTKQVNEFITKNNIRANQYQFDAMTSFSYNCGSGWWNGTAQFDLRVLLLNAVNPNSVQSKINSGSTVKGTVSLKAPVYKSKKQTGSPSKTLNAGTAVTIKAASWDNTNKAAWYQVTAGGTTGYVPAPYIQITSHTFEKNMNYMDAVTFGSELLCWHHAGGNCYAGLVYRRLGEAKLFSFGNYAGAKNNSSEKGVNSPGYLVPSCIANKGWLK